MLMKKWNELPKEFQTAEIKQYYDILAKRTAALIIKRSFDIIMSLLLLLILSPVFLVIAVMIKAETKGAVFYRQKRITQYGKSFRIYKFRTMIVNADQLGTLVTLQGDERITKTGKRIRKCRLDELPQLINVLKGEMTFVGTRPEVEKYVEAYSDAMKATLLLPAGITSLASIRYKDEDEILAKYPQNVDEAYINIVLSEKMKYNLEYLIQFSIWQDLKLCFLTIAAVLHK